MMRLATLLLLLTMAIPAQAQRRVRVRVVDVAGGRAFLQPGEERGIRVGQRARIGRRNYRIVAVTRGAAVVELGARRLRVGARGNVRVRRQRGGGAEHGLDEVTPLERFQGQWPEPTMPSAGQHPDPVPLGQTTSKQGSLRLAAMIGTLLRVPLGSEGDILGRAIGRVRLHIEPLSERPLSVDVDAQAQLWMGRDVSQRAGDGSRPFLLVRRLELSYGRDASVALGRLRRAATFVGTIDGARVRTPTVAGISFGAFGGIVPNPTNGTPNFDVSRFGVEARYDRPDHALRPTAAIVAHGSTFNGIDERRLAAEMYLYPQWGSAGGFVELSMFRPNNRWDSSRVDLTAAGLDFGFHAGAFSAHIHGGLRKPERSRFLDSLLPPEWSCTTVAQVGSPEDEVCDGFYDARHYGTADVGVQIGERIDLRVGGAVSHTGTRDELDIGTGFVQLRVARIANILHTSVMAEASGGSLLRRYGGRLELGAGPIAGMVELSLHYGAGVGMLRADQKLYVEHRAGGSVYLTLKDHWRVRLVGDALVGGPTSAMLIQGQLIWSL